MHCDWIFQTIWQHSTLMVFDILQCNIAQGYEAEAALQGADCVYHMASYGMSGREQVSYFICFVWYLNEVIILLILTLFTSVKFQISLWRQNTIVA